MTENTPKKGAQTQMIPRFPPAAESPRQPKRFGVWGLGVQLDLLEALTFFMGHGFFLSVWSRVLASLLSSQHPAV
jgi:hypothetical protein